MSKEKGKTQNKKRKLTRQEKKQIDALIRQSKGDGKPHTAQDSIPFERMYKDGICRLANGRYSKCIEFEDINYQLAQPDDKTAIFEALCDMYNSFDASISVQLSLISRHANKEDFKSSITIAPQNDDFDSIRAEYTEMLQRFSHYRRRYYHLRPGSGILPPCGTAERAGYQGFAEQHAVH